MTVKWLDCNSWAPAHSKTDCLSDDLVMSEPERKSFVAIRPTLANTTIPRNSRKDHQRWRTDHTLSGFTQ